MPFIFYKRLKLSRRFTAMDSQDWQRSLHTVRDRNRHLFISKNFADCTFEVGEISKEYKAHKVIMSTASSVFENIIHRSSERDTFAIPDVDPESFEIVLEYIYTDRINLEKCEDLTKIHTMAEKFHLPGLVGCSIKFMLSDLEPCNTLRYYEFAKCVENSILMDKCVEVIQAETIKVLTHEHFCYIKCETLFDISCMKELNIDSELDLFLAIERFAIANDVFTNTNPDDDMLCLRLYFANSKLLRFVQKAVRKVRFLTITPKRFAEATAKSKLLTQNEKYALLHNISSGNDKLCPMPKGFTKISFSRIRSNSLPLTFGLWDNNWDA